MRDLESVSWWNAGMREIARRLLDKAALPPNGRLLDAGCGSGLTMSWFLRSHPGWTATGIDIAAEPLAAAQVADLPVQQATALDLPFASSSFDLVITLDLMQHLPLDGGDTRALAEFARVLRPGGVLLVRTNAQAFPRVKDDPAYSYRRYDPEQLRRRLVDAGFDVVVLGRTNSLLGLAEIPRELRARRENSPSYQGLLAEPKSDAGIAYRLKKSWLELEGRAMSAGWQLPFGRTIFALCRVNSRR
jgi:SAM-dependent methyltransferase